MKMSRHFPLNAMRVFEAAARHMSFTRAGAELGLTQTAVSYQIKLLEDTLGEQLFLRQPRQVSLTDAGLRLAPKVTEAFAILQDAVTGLKDTSEGTLTIHSTATFASRWLARHLGTFQLENPGIAVRLETSQEVIDFSKTEADLAIRSGKGVWPGLKAHLLMRSHFTPMLSPQLAETGSRHPPISSSFASSTRTIPGGGCGSRPPACRTPILPAAPPAASACRPSRPPPRLPATASRS